ncbi:MAG: ATP-binding protein, partial [Calditrichaeota bacterium]
MAKLDIQKTRELLQDFNFKLLFIDELGWLNPVVKKRQTIDVNGAVFDIRHIAQLGGVVVVEVTSADGVMPQAKMRAAVHREFSKLYFENLLIFVDKERTHSLWYWVKREGKQNIAREHLYMKGQPGDLFLSKLNAMVVDIGAFEQGEPSVIDAVKRLKQALDVEATTKRFYTEYDALRLQFVELIEGIDDERKRQWYASVLLNRLMFI